MTPYERSRDYRAADRGARRAPRAQQQSISQGAPAVLGGAMTWTQAVTGVAAGLLLAFFVIWAASR
jgi:hypothetical protein